MKATAPSLSAILLAAGEGSRLGCIPKSLMRLAGRSLIEHQILALLNAGADKIIVVTGYYYSTIEAELDKIMPKLALQQQESPDFSDEKSTELDKESSASRHAIHIVRNPAPERGQQSSVLLGLETLSQLRNAEPLNNHQGTNDPVLIALVDQPLMLETDYQACVTAFHQRPADCSIVYPVVRGQRGNPVALSANAAEDVLHSGLTCREYIDRHKEHVHTLTTDNDHFIVDIDEERDRLLFEQRTKLTLSLPEGT